MSNTFYWTEFCGNKTIYDALWADNLTWNTNNPDFTWCFQGTVLALVPAIYIVLAILSLEAVSYLDKKQIHAYPPAKSTLHRIKLGIGLTICALLLISMSKCLYDVVNLNKHAVMLFATISQLISYLLASYLMHLQHRRWSHTSGVQFTFWTIQLILGTVTFRSTVIQLQKGLQTDAFLLIIFYVYYLLIILQWILVLLVDKSILKPQKGVSYKSSLMGSYSNEETPLLGDKKHLHMQEPEKEYRTNKSPEESASFLSCLHYFWYFKILLMGWRKVLEFDDLPDIQDRDKTKTVTEAFYKEWDKQLTKKHKAKPNTVGKETEPSLFIAILKSLGIGMFYAGVFRLATAFLVFSGPMLLRVLLNFIESGSVYAWQGYFIAVSIFLTSQLHVVLIQKFLYHSLNFGTRLRTLVTAVVYRKALRLSSAAKKQTTVGEIVNLMSVDAQKLQEVPPFICTIFTVPISLIIATWLLWQTVGIAALSGLAVIALIIPFNGLYVVNKVRKLQAKQMGYKDQRIITMSEVLAGIKVIKLYAWERFFQGKISSQREQELTTIKWVNVLNAFSAVAWNTSSYLITLAVLGTYVFISETNVLNADKIFVTFALVNILNFPMALLAMAVGFVGQAIVSLKRVKKFLLLDEIDDTAVDVDNFADNAIRVEQGRFSWGSGDLPVLKDIDLTIDKGELIAVVGQVGSGKSSLISALLGEMNKLGGTVTRSGGIAYVPQQAWIQLNSLKNNILFGQPVNSHVYNNVIKHCALEHDLTILPDGDQTEIGEKGINLSGGQKQRVSLARAVYQNEDIYLLDDPLSAVDAHVGKHLFENIIGPTGMLKRKTRILVTHSLTYLPFVDRIVVLHDGKIRESGSYEELLRSNGAFAEFLNTYMEEKEHLEEPEKEILKARLSITGEEGDSTSKRLSRPLSNQRSKNDLCSVASKESSLRQRKLSEKHKTATEVSLQDKLLERQQSIRPKQLITTESSAVGQVSGAAVKEYMGAAGWVWMIIIVVFHILCCVSMVLGNIWLSLWSADKPVIINGTATQPSNTYERLGVYAALILSQVITIQLGSFGIALGCYSASRLLHNNIVSRVLRAPMMFFDTTPLGRIMNRCSKDMDYVDVNIPFITRNWLFMLVPMFAILIVMIYSTPIIVAAAVPIGIIFILIQRFYIRAVRQLKRIDGVKRSPVFIHFDETIVGSSSIRAYRRQKEFTEKCDQLTDESQRAWYLVTLSMRWIGVNMETLGNFVTFFASLFAILQGADSSVAGLSVSYSLQIALSMNLFVRWSTELETYLVAVERIKEYSEVDTEADWDRPDETPSVTWPTHGQVEYRNYITKYRSELDPVLHGVNCIIKPREKIGVVGRTGAGKSSLALSLFRIMEATGGNIYIDGLEISRLGLYDLRSRLTIIPQDPVIFCGTLRSNLDPVGVNSEKELWECLEMAHLKEFASTVPGGLDYQCGEGGEALSVGQRQLLCLARALLRNNKILVLDEATSGVDLETDDLIQSTIRIAFKHCTIITIAHRLNTVMDYDRIMVLDKGKVIEFDSPEMLLKNTSSVFYEMAKDAKLC